MAQKKLNCSVKELKRLIEPMKPKLSISNQCELIGVPRSPYCFEVDEESEYNLLLMKLIDEQYTKAPFYGTRKMTGWLQWQRWVSNEPKENAKAHETDGNSRLSIPRRSWVDHLQKGRNIHTYERIWQLPNRIRFGLLISFISGWKKDSCIWSQSKTGITGMY